MLGVKTIMEDYQVQQPFYNWISDVLRDIPDETIAFVFNIYEEEDVYLVDISGTTEYDADNENWTESINWDSGEEMFIIPKEKFEGDWEEIHDLIAESLETLIDEETELSDTICDSKVVAVGFIDGDLEIVWQE